MHTFDMSQECGIWALASLCRLHRIPFDARIFLQRFPPGERGAIGLVDLLLAADELGLSSTQIDSPAQGIASAFLAFLHPVAPDSAESDTNARQRPCATPILIAHIDEQGAHYLQAGVEEAQVCPHAELSTRIIPSWYVFESKPEAIRDEDGVKALKSKPFGFSWFVPEILKHKKVWRDVLAASLALQLVGLATPLLTQVVIDKVVVHQSQNTLVAVGVGMAIAILFGTIFTWVRQYLLLHTGNRVDAALGSRVLTHLLRLPLRYFAHRPTGTLVARLQGVETIREFLSGAAVSLILDLPFMTVLVAIMFWYSWQLSLIVLGMLALLGLLSLAVTPLFRERLNHQFLLGARNQAFVTEYVSGMETVKALQLEPQLEKRYGGYLASYLAASFDTKQLANFYNVAANALEQLQTLLILVIGALLVMGNNGFTVGMLVAFQMFAGRLSQPALKLVGLYQEFQQASLSVKRLGDLMNAPAEPYTLIPARTGSGEGQIELDNVSFRYAEDAAWLFRDLSLDFPPGKLTLIMGPSGSGKSTIAKLLLGFYRPSQGRILLDGKDTRYLSANELRGRFGVVPQETLLFAGTLYENLLMAAPTASFDDIVTACRMAEIHESIEKLPQGYQTEIGEQGVGLSGGQKQRIAIARSLLKRPRILIFDEATSNLDVHTAEHFAATVNQLKGQVTIVFIAHQVPKALQVDKTVIVGGPSKERLHASEQEAQQ